MKITKYLLGLGLVAGLGLTSCSNDEPAVGGGLETDGNESFFATVSLSLPTANASRSTTIVPGEGDTSNSNDGSLDGEDYENKIKSILVVLATLNDSGEYSLQTVNQGDASYDGGTAASPKYTLKFNQQIVLELAGKKVYPFVICNPDAQTVNKFSKLSRNDVNFVNDIVSLSDPNNFSGWLNNNFLMTNSYIDKTATAITLPNEATLKGHTTSNNPFNLTSAGPIKVERTVARFDFKKVKDSYEIKTNASTSPTTIGYVTITGMALINEAQDFYTFRRVSDTGTSVDWTIGGIETPKNYMVSPNADVLSDRNFLLAGFNTTGALAPESFEYTSVSDFGTDYKIWRYATENAIPGYSNQKKGVTTGVVFKGQMSFVKGSDLDKAAATGKPLYKFGNTIYGALTDLVAEIEANPNTYLAYQAKEAGLYTGIGSDGKLTGLNENEDTFNVGDGPQLSKYGFTIYRADDNKNYNVYYYYWNRHNDNGDPNVMGIMEFGVVRNNVYRLAVNNIYNFGHPGDPKDDDTPENPGDDDETVDLYISLDVQVLPWTVRINNIEF